MKVLMVFALCLVLAGCGGPKKDTPAATTKCEPARL